MAAVTIGRVMMSPYDRAGAPFLSGLATCTSHLDTDEVIEIVRSRAGESELNDLLRHAVNRLVRSHDWIVEREVSDRDHRLSRVDLAMTETGSEMRFAWVEAKLKYASDAVDSPDVFINGGNSIAKDAGKLFARSTDTPAFLLTWVPYVSHSTNALRYGAGHSQGNDGWRVRLDLDRCRDACAALLHQFGDAHRVEVHSGTGKFGALVLDAWWTPVHPKGTTEKRD